MAGAELSPLVPFPEQAGQLGTFKEIADNLNLFHTHFMAGTLYAQFKKANPGEAGRLETYWANAAQWPTVATQTGIALRSAYQARHEAGG